MVRVKGSDNLIDVYHVGSRHKIQACQRSDSLILHAITAMSAGHAPVRGKTEDCCGMTRSTNLKLGLGHVQQIL